MNCKSDEMQQKQGPIAHHDLENDQIRLHGIAQSCSSEESKQPCHSVDLEISSNLAFDRHLSLCAVGYTNGLIKVFSTVKETQIEVHKYPVVQMIFTHGTAQLLSVDLKNQLVHTDLATKETLSRA